MSSLVSARPSLFSVSPSVCVGPSNKVSFYHGYHLDEMVLLLSFPIRECTTASGGRVSGVPIPFALIACGIVADNRYVNTYLALRPDPTGPLHRISPEYNDGVLLGGEILYFVSGIENSTYELGIGNGICERYPIIDDFRLWEFPHGRLPDLWSAAYIPVVIGATGAPYCLVTADTDAVEKAHIIPRAEVAWFRKNRMRLYDADNLGIHSSSNILSLRADIHTMYDARRFLLLPKSLTEGGRTPMDSDRTEWRTWEFGSGRTTRFRDNYHDRTTAMPFQGVSKEYLFARFAWSVLGSSEMVGQEEFIPDEGLLVVREGGRKRKPSVLSGSSTNRYLPRAKRGKTSEVGEAGGRVIEEVEALLAEEGLDAEDFIDYLRHRGGDEPLEEDDGVVERRVIANEVGELGEVVEGYVVEDESVEGEGVEGEGLGQIQAETSRAEIEVENLPPTTSNSSVE